MKRCNNCGTLNPDVYNYCVSCGHAIFDHRTYTYTQDNQTIKLEEKNTNQQRYTQTPNQQQNPIQPIMNMKSPLMALILSLIIPGLGNLYNNLNNRAIKEFLIFIILLILSSMIVIFTEVDIMIVIFLILAFSSIIWYIFVLYDSYNCSQLINKNQKIPPLFG